MLRWDETRGKPGNDSVLNGRGIKKTGRPDKQVWYDHWGRREHRKSCARKIRKIGVGGNGQREIICRPYPDGI